MAKLPLLFNAAYLNIKPLIVDSAYNDTRATLPESGNGRYPARFRSS